MKTGTVLFRNFITGNMLWNRRFSRIVIEKSSKEPSWKFRSSHWKKSHSHATKVATTDHQYLARDTTNKLFSYNIRTLKKTEIPEIMKLRKEIGIHDCQSCFESWIQLDPEGIIVAEHESGKFIGMISAIIDPEDFAFLGAYAVKKDFRGSGIGIQVWNSAIAHIGNRNAGLHAVPERTNDYLNRGGFPVMAQDFVCIKNITTTNINPAVLNEMLPKNVGIFSFDDSLLETVVAYDFKVMGYNRTLLIQLNCTEENSRTLVAMRDGHCVGFGTIKLSCLDAGRVGPLYADDKQIAEALLKELLISCPETNGFAMTTLSNNKSANRLMSKMKTPATLHLPQLYNRKRVEVDYKKIFAVYDLNGAPF